MLPTNLSASSIGIIGGADGPTAIFVTAKISPWGMAAIALLAVLAVAAIGFIVWRIVKKKK